MEEKVATTPAVTPPSRRIEPTKGRVLYYHDRTEGRFAGSETFVAALLCGVNTDGTINVLIVTEDGIPRGLCNVPLVQPDDEVPAEGGYAAWMPFQVGQAAKTEDVIGKLADRFDALVARVADERQFDKDRADEHSQRITAVEDHLAKLIDKLAHLAPAPAA